MAAYHLRSFSESESWNIRIECSISGLYDMGGRPWRGLDCPCHGYTVWTTDRELIESEFLNNGRPLGRRIRRKYDGELHAHILPRSITLGLALLSRAGSCG